MQHVERVRDHRRTNSGDAEAKLLREHAEDFRRSNPRLAEPGSTAAINLQVEECRRDVGPLANVARGPRRFDRSDPLTVDGDSHRLTVFIATAAERQHSGHRSRSRPPGKTCPWRVCRAMRLNESAGWRRRPTGQRRRAVLPAGRSHPAALDSTLRIDQVQHGQRHVLPVAADRSPLPELIAKAAPCDAVLPGRFLTELWVVVAVDPDDGERLRLKAGEQCALGRNEF